MPQRGKHPSADVVQEQEAVRSLLHLHTGSWESKLFPEVLGMWQRGGNKNYIWLFFSWIVKLQDPPCHSLNIKCPQRLIICWRYSPQLVAPITEKAVGSRGLCLYWWINSQRESWFIDIMEGDGSFQRQGWVGENKSLQHFIGDESHLDSFFCLSASWTPWSN